jgi:hypothetical protein
MSNRYRLRSSPAGWLVSLFVASLLLVACGSAATPEPTSQPTVTEASTVSEPTNEPTATEAIAQATQLPESTPMQTTDEPVSPVAGGAPGCRTEPITSQINLPKATIAPVTDADWQHGGGPEARVTFVEYGDYQ